MRFIEEVIQFEVATATNGVVETNATTPDGSTVIGCVIYHNGLDTNSDMITASISADQGEISALQHIDNYRSREASYDRGYKPLPHFASGKKVRLEIRSESAFTADFKGQLILIKVPQNC